MPVLERWLDEGHRFALATVTHTWGSSPRPVGAVMGVREDGAVVGSVSGGCVESAVIQASVEALSSGDHKLLDFGALSDESVWEVGLSCGGRIQVWVDPDPIRREAWRATLDAIRRNRPAVLVTRFEPFDQWLWQAGEPWSGPAFLAGSLGLSRSGEVEAEGERYFLHAFPQRERLVIVGAVHIAIPLVKFARELGFETIVIDPRPALASNERFPVPPDTMIAQWPEQALAGIELTPETYGVVLTHDPKIDDVALAAFLRSPMKYVGALGSRVTQEKRRRELGALGFDEAELARIHGPVGLNIAARSPEEIALSIAAEIVQVRRAKS
ncbi:MAG TPA: XdhC family protein [Fimbriimonadaceae bacterium]|nr:XdhC family protein [Fimbriimonadaceae bacterium]